MAADAGLTVLVHHSRALVREGLVAALRREPSIRHAAAVEMSDLVPSASSEGLLRRADVLVVELASSPNAAWQRLAECDLPARLRVLGTHTGVSLDDARRAFDLGVRALVPDSAGLDGLMGALVPAGWTRTALTGRTSSAPVLDEVEVAVLRRLSLGTSSRGGAAELGISATRFDDAKRRAFAKLGVGHQAQAVAAALRHGLLDDPIGGAARLDTQDQSA